MKIRTGFVSNSSSSSFILDLRKPGVKELLGKVTNQNRHLPGLGRSTCCIHGKDLIDSVKYELRHWDWDHGNWILFWANKLGEDNILYMRESDEEMGGVLFDLFDNADWVYEWEKDLDPDNPYAQLRELAEAEQECH